MQGRDGPEARPENRMLTDAVRERLNGRGASTSDHEHYPLKHDKGNKKHTYRTAGKNGKHKCYIVLQRLLQTAGAHHALVLPVMLRYMHSDLRTGTLTDDQGQIICVETARGHKRIYRRLDRHGEGGDGFDVTDDKVITACRHHF